VTTTGNASCRAAGNANLTSQITLRANNPKCTNAVFFQGVPVTVTQPPHIDNIDPNIAMIGTNSLQLTINGSNFGTSPSVNLPAGFSTSGQGSTSTRITITVSIGFAATIGANSISVSVDNVPSNSVPFTVDGPTHMIVQGDTIGRCSGCSTSVARFVNYQIVNYSGTNSGTVVIGEAPTASGWSCMQPNPGSSYASCTTSPFTASGGFFTDLWSINSDAYTPSGCGFNITDHWQWCATSPPHTFGTLTGYVHTDAININGYINPPQSMPVGTVINP